MKCFVHHWCSYAQIYEFLFLNTYETLCDILYYNSHEYVFDYDQGNTIYWFIHCINNIISTANSNNINAIFK